MPLKKSLKSKPDFYSKEAGYTLTELLVVLVIVSLLISVSAPRLMSRLGGAKSTVAQTQAYNLVSGLKLYRLDVGDYPSEDEGLQALLLAPEGVDGWNGPYMPKSEIAMDPWKRPYLYTVSDDGARVTVTSLGKDGKTGGEKENADIIAEE